MRPRSLILLSVPAAVLVYFCYRYVDPLVARAVEHVLWTHRGARPHMPDMPDLLLPLVVAVTAAGWTGRFVLAGDPTRERLRNCLALLGIVAPVAYVTKILLKWSFGRIRTRDWLVQPQLDGFHWFHGTGIFDGFPSGHMMVIGALAAVVWRYYPTQRWLVAMLLAVLAGALVLLDYHFVSDVIAGGCCGYLVYWVAWQRFG